ncbi:MAG TPA: hypothetical protein VLI93_11470 [Acetobacteraceae bacterium]|nr:hypothetical protein [Acetobacteraceae bacterium]
MNAAALVVAGTVCGMLLDRRFLIVPLLTLGFLAMRPMLPRLPELAREGQSLADSPVSQDEIEALSRRLHELQTA